MNRFAGPGGGPLQGGGEHFRSRLFRPHIRGGQHEVQIGRQAQVSAKLVEIPPQIGDDPQAVALVPQLRQGRAGIGKGDEILGDADGDLPDLPGQVQGYRQPRLFQQELLVAGKESQPLRRAALGQGLDFVLPVEIDVGDRIAVVKGFGVHVQAQLPAGGLLNLIQRRPEPHQGIVEVKKYGFNHLPCPGCRDGDRLAPEIRRQAVRPRAL